jgi:hypothetical protein
MIGQYLTQTNETCYTLLQEFETLKRLNFNQRPVRLAYQSPASSTFLSEQTSHPQPASSTFLSEKINTSHQSPAKRTGCN